MVFSFEALRDSCDRCEGRHSSTFHFPRKIAANALARGETVIEAARASHMPEATVAYWAQADVEFRAQVERARLRQLRKVAKKTQRGSAA